RRRGLPDALPRMRMNRLRRLAGSARRLPSRGLAAARRRPRTAIGAGLLVTGLAIVLVVLGVGAMTGKTPLVPTGPTFTVRTGWTLADLERHIQAGEIDAITAAPPSDGSSTETILARTRSGQVVSIDLSVTPQDAVSALTALGYGSLLTTEALGLARPAASAGPSILMLLVALLLVTGTILMVWRLSRRAAGGSRDAPSRFTTILPPDPATSAQAALGDGDVHPVARITLDDVAGCDEAKLELTETIEFLRSPERFRRLGARIPRGIMLYGPPGTGKTMLARAVAAEAGVPFHYASGSEFVEKYVGVGAKRVRDLFAQARKLGRGVIFFDEFDAIGKARGGPNSHEEREQTLNQLLVELDGFASSDDVIVIAATNRLDTLDSAVLRPGRFNRKIHVGMPDVKGRRAILDVHARNKPLAPTTDLEEVARKTYGFSGAMLADLLNEAAIMTARRGGESIESEDLHAGWLKVAVGTSRRRSMDERERSIIAAHEVGHAICGKVHGDKRKVEEISLFAHGEALGVTVSSQEDNDLPSETDLRARLIALMGGRAAEEILFHEVTGGASNDFEQANRIATTMVTKWGMGRDPEASDGGISGRGSLSFLVPTNGRSFPSDVQAAATRAIRAILDEAYAEASRTLVAHLDTLRRLAAYLVEHERVDGATFDELFEGRRVVVNAEDEWRAATSRPRAWADVVDLAGRRVSGGVAATPVPVAAVAAVVPGTEAPAGSGSDVAAIGSATATEAAGSTVTAAATIEGPGARAGLSGDELVAPDAVATAPSAPTEILAPSARVRRSGSRRVRRVAAGILGRAERWLRGGELEADRL
ncbi:MAG TPA: AAA family ATPase, partial [Candidatus Limnocylindrales bacterium]|nr:AAA family ATPase [Candidatus Limnocylindrales bacterium]